MFSLIKNLINRKGHAGALASKKKSEVKNLLAGKRSCKALYYLTYGPLTISVIYLINNILLV